MTNNNFTFKNYANEFKKALDLVDKDKEYFVKKRSNQWILKVRKRKSDRFWFIRGRKEQMPIPHHIQIKEVLI